MDIEQLITSHGNAKYHWSVKSFFKLILSGEENVKQKITELKQEVETKKEAQESFDSSSRLGTLEREFNKNIDYSEEITFICKLCSDTQFKSFDNLLNVYQQIKDTKLLHLLNASYGGIKSYFNPYLKTNQQNYWSMFTGRKNEYYDLFKQEKFIALTWGKTSDFSIISDEGIKTYVEQNYPEKEITSTYRTFLNFVNDINEGDIVVLKQTKTNIVTIAQIDGKMYFEANQQPQLQNRYKINILVEDVELNMTYMSTLNKINKHEYIEKIKAILNPQPVLKGENKIWAGAPGTGKSYLINQYLKGQAVNVNRVTFYPDYEYHDFIGSILPVTIMGKIEYQFVPGPFTMILKEALLNPQQNYYLVIEEMTRGNCAAIFGDIFQLLDRDDTGKSQYPITNLQLQAFLGNLITDKVFIPSNLSIYGTINTSDQNVYPMDTAFKRRFKFEYLSVYDNQEQINPDLMFLNQKWSTFYLRLNEYLLNNLHISEDKQLGPFFIESSENDAKIIMYLWQDVIGSFRNANQLFHPNVNTLTKALSCKTIEALFNENFINYLKSGM